MNVLNQLIESRFAIYNGDSVEVLKGLPDDSVHYSIFSPPFCSLYVYSNSDRDMGNSSTDSEFWQHFKYLITSCNNAWAISIGPLYGFTTHEIQGRCYRNERLSW